MIGTHLRNLDLNLLLPLQALLEERSVTRAGKRVFLTQSAMSRNLERLRSMMGDELLIPSEGQYRLTKKAEILLRDLNLLLPHIQQVLSGVPFSPRASEACVRIAMTDNASSVILPRLMALLLEEAPQITVSVLPWHDNSYDDLTSGAVDLVFSPLAVPKPFLVEKIFRDPLICIVAEEHPFTESGFTMKQYLQQRHIAVQTQRKQNLIDRTLSEAGKKRNVVLEVPYFASAMLSLAKTDLVLTSHKLFADKVMNRYNTRAIEAPHGFPLLTYSMVWHPRLHKDPLNMWLRELTLRQFEAERGGNSEV